MTRTRYQNRSLVLLAGIVLGGPVFWSAARAGSPPPYSGAGASVFVPFTNATDMGDPTKYVSPRIRVGFGSPNATADKPAFDVTMDTGSVGVVAGSAYFTPPAKGRLDSSFIGPGIETLTSSGVIFNGDWYLAVVNLYSSNAVVASAKVPVMAISSVTCAPHPRDCTKGSGASVHYFGVGFAGGPGQPQGTPDKNAFLNVTSVPGGGAPPSSGYILSRQGVQIGLTASNTQGFAMIKLEPVLSPNSTQWQTLPASANVLTDWQHARGTLTVNGKSSNVGVLFDTGVTTGFLTPPYGVKVSTGSGPAKAECNGTKPHPSCAVSGTEVELTFPHASLNYTVGAGNGAQDGNPVSPYAVSVESTGAAFLNTSVRFLQAFDYLYDSANGFVGLKATGNTPANHAASTASVSVQGVFRCFFNQAGVVFGLPAATSNNQYAWPNTYRSYPNDTVVAVSSGSAASGSTPATGANHVYLGGSGGQTDESGLADWLAEEGCQ